MIQKRAIVLIAVFLVIVVIFALGATKKTMSAATRSDIPTVPLSEEERQIVNEELAEAEMISDLPEKDIVAIKFYDYNTPDGEKRYRDTFRVTNDGVVSSGKSSVLIYMHSKYIDEFKEKDFCRVISQAIDKGDVSYTSDYGKVRLLLKYKNMLKHRDCLGV